MSLANPLNSILTQLKDLSMLPVTPYLHGHDVDEIALLTLQEAHSLSVLIIIIIIIIISDGIDLQQS